MPHLIDNRKLLDEIPQILWTATPTGELDFLNLRAREYFRAPEDELLGNAWIGRVHPDDVARTLEQWKVCIGSGHPCSVEYRIRLGEAGYRWVLAQARPILDAAGKPAKWVGTCLDIHALKEYEAKLQEQTLLLENARDAIYSSCPEGIIHYWNKGAERIFGWTAEEAIGRRAGDFLVRSPEEESAARERVLKEGALSMEMTKLAKGGREVLVMCSCTLLRDEQGEPKTILSIESDITEQRRVENQLVRAQRLESLGTLAGGIAHDINNMLSPIIMAADLLRMLNTKPDDLPMLNTILECARRAAGLVQQVLSFSHGVEGSVGVIFVPDLVAELSRMIKETFPKNVRLEVRLAENLPCITGDSTQMIQVLLNLCVNARDAMPSGGALRITAAPVELDEHYCAMEVGVKPGRYLRIEVSDTGIGMSKDVLDRIFDPFFTTKELGSGTGLGLSTTLGIVKSHGGFIRVESQRGKGTTFRLFLPVCEVDGGQSTVAPIDLASSLHGTGQVIMLVDDERSIRDVSKRILESHGYKVVAAGDGAEGIATYVSLSPKPDVVLCDVNMPVMDGLAFSRALLRIEPSARIVGMSGVSGKNVATQLSAIGVEHFLAKPYSAETLLQTVKEVLKGEPPRSAGNPASG